MGTYFTVKALWLLLSGALLGLAYFLFLPVIMACAILLTAIGRTVHFPSFTWRPMEAYLAGKRTTKKRKMGNKKSEQR
jgi:hypothetical protein